MNRTIATLKKVCVGIVAVTLSHPSAAAEPSAPNPTIDSAAKASNQFAVDLYGKLSSAKGNLFFSPSSISTALDMVYAGAKADTAKQMVSVLHLNSMPSILNGDQIHSAAGQLIRNLNDGGKNESNQLCIANRLWGQQGFKLLDSFSNLVRKNYGAELEQLDFDQPEAARKTINGWVEQATNQKIQDLIPPRALNAATRLVLTNAVYFKGTWQHEFKANSTAPAPFFLSADNKVDVRMMHRTGDYRFAEASLGGKGLKVLVMPYKSAAVSGNRLAMVLLLPDEVAGLPDLERQISASKLRLWGEQSKSETIVVTVPKFKLTQEFQLSDALSSLGMPLAFDNGKADFSGIDGRQDLFLSAVFHKAFIDVNEEGTEAAAATGAIMAPTAVPIFERPKEPKQFRADHPFIFLIRDEATGCILFMGRLTDPRG